MCTFLANFFLFTLQENLISDATLLSLFVSDFLLKL